MLYLWYAEMKVFRIIREFMIQCWIFTFLKQSFNESSDFLLPFIASWITQIWLAAAKLLCPCNMHQTHLPEVIDSKPHPSRMCKTSLLFAPLAVRVQAGCSTFLFYTPSNQKQLYFKYKTVLIPKLKKNYI